MSINHAQCRNCLWKNDCAFYGDIDRKCKFHNTKRQFVKKEVFKQKEQKLNASTG